MVRASDRSIHFLAVPLLGWPVNYVGLRNTNPDASPTFFFFFFNGLFEDASVLAINMKVAFRRLGLSTLGFLRDVAVQDGRPSLEPKTQEPCRG